MSRACRLLMGAVLLVVVATPAFSQQATRGDRALVEVARLLDVKVGRFLGHGNDFVGYSRSISDSTQFLLLSSLGIEAERAAASVQATQIMLLLYTYTFFHPARADARTMVQETLDRYIEKLDASVARVNDFISMAQIAAVVHSASRMKDDLRETIDLLKSIRLP